MMTDYPDDENGRVLQSMFDSGVDLTVERDVEFAHRAPDEALASTLAARAKALGYDVEVYEPDEESLEEGDTDWDVLCTRRMVPTHEAITAAESELARVARELGCREDGWGFMES